MTTFSSPQLISTDTVNKNTLSEEQEQEQALSQLPPRKRARTDEEKEQRRVERIIRNRRAAHASREKKRRHVELLELYVKQLEFTLESRSNTISSLLSFQSLLLEKLKEAGITIDPSLNKIDDDVLNKPLRPHGLSLNDDNDNDDNDDHESNKKDSKVSVKSGCYEFIKKEDDDEEDDDEEEEEERDNEHIESKSTDKCKKKGKQNGKGNKKVKTSISDDSKSSIKSIKKRDNLSPQLSSNDTFLQLKVDQLDPSNSQEFTDSNFGMLSPPSSTSPSKFKLSGNDILTEEFSNLFDDEIAGSLDIHDIQMNENNLDHDLNSDLLSNYISTETFADTDESMDYLGLFDNVHPAVMLIYLLVIWKY